MNSQIDFVERIQHAFRSTERGVIGIVDELLTASVAHRLRIDWQAGVCRVSSVNSGCAESTEITLNKSVFRAILARIATLCNDRVPNSVSAYRGEGEFAVEVVPSRIFWASFVNTPSEQHLELKATVTEVEPNKTPVPVLRANESIASSVEPH